MYGEGTGAIDHNLVTIGDNDLYYEISLSQVRLLQANLYCVRPQLMLAKGTGMDILYRYSVKSVDFTHA